MGTITRPAKGGDDERVEAGPDAGTCGVLGQMEMNDERIRLMGLFVRTHRRLTMSTLSADVSLTTGGVTRLVDRMVEAGLVARQNCPNDRRSIHVVLTTEGRAVLEQAIAAHVDGIDRHLIAHLDAGDRAALEVALTKVLDAGC